MKSSPWHFLLTDLSSFSFTPEIQYDRRAHSQPAGGAGLPAWWRTSPEWIPGPDVAGSQDETAAEIHHPALPVLPEHQELQLLHLPNCVSLSPSSRLSLSFMSTASSPSSSSSCSVKGFSQHFSEMSPVKQKWIYTFFMYPFLSGDRVAGKTSMLIMLMLIIIITSNQLEIT